MFVWLKWGSNVVHVRQPHTGGLDRGKDLVVARSVYLDTIAGPMLRAKWGPGILVVRCGVVSWYEVLSASVGRGVGARGVAIISDAR
jgi:hypothetical protein